MFVFSPLSQRHEMPLPGRIRRTSLRISIRIEFTAPWPTNQNGTQKDISWQLLDHLLYPSRRVVVVPRRQAGDSSVPQASVQTQVRIVFESRRRNRRIFRIGWNCFRVQGLQALQIVGSRRSRTTSRRIQAVHAAGGGDSVMVI